MSRNRRTGRRSPLASVALLLIGLLSTGGVYAVVTSTATASTAATAQASAEEGEKLFLANCASCHGQGAVGTTDGPHLMGVGAAAVDFQVGTGRMPMAASGPQAEVKPVQFTEEQIQSLALYVATLGDGPAIPDAKYLTGKGDVAGGAELFRINCAMCHNVAGAGGALTEGKYAPALRNIQPVHVYEAMVTGPQNMPVFNDMNISPDEKGDIIAYLEYLNDNPAPGGFELGGIGPVAEGLFVWIFALGSIVGVTVWLTSRAN